MSDAKTTSTQNHFESRSYNFATKRTQYTWYNCIYTLRRRPSSKLTTHNWQGTRMKLAFTRIRFKSGKRLFNLSYRERSVMSTSNNIILFITKNSLNYTVCVQIKRMSLGINCLNYYIQIVYIHATGRRNLHGSVNHTHTQWSCLNMTTRV